MISISRFKKVGVILTISQLMLSGCGGGGGGSKDNTSGSSINSSTSVISSSRVSSSSSSNQTSISSSQLASSQSSNQNQSSSENNQSLLDVSNQFTSSTNEDFYVFRNPSMPDDLLYLPKQLALNGLPGIASIQRLDKISNLLDIFLEPSDTDWNSENQITFSSKFTLDVDLQQLRQESEIAGYAELVDLKVKPPVMMFEQRYTSLVPSDRIQIQCTDLTLVVENNSITLHDCNLADVNGIINKQTINNIAGFRYEQLNFDPAAISGNNSLRGTLSVDYTLPGTQKFDQILSTDNGDLQNTWQLYLNWPLMQTTVSSATVTIDWKTLLLNFNVQVSAGGVRWDQKAIDTFIAFAISTDAITLPENTELTPALNVAIGNYLKQELFVAIYSETGSTPLFWAPKLRIKNLDQQNTQEIVMRYFDSDLSIISTIDLSCLAKPDEQNNIYKSSDCDN